MRRLFAAIVFAALATIAGERPQPARAACGAVPYLFSPTISQLTSASTNGNNADLYQCATNVDFSQIGAAGIFASQIKPASATTATFGGTYPFVFPAGINAGGPVTTTGVTSSGPISAPSLALSGPLGATAGFQVATVQAIAPPSPSPTNGNLIVTWGDSITAGVNASSCVSGTTSSTYVVTQPGSASGTCWPDLLARDYNVPVVNMGLPGSRLQHCANAANCSNVTSGVDRYNASTDLVSRCSANAIVYFLYGRNDATTQAAGAEPTFGYDNFRTGYEGAMRACHAAGTPYSSMIVMTIPMDLNPSQIIAYGLDSEVARAAIDLGANFVDVGGYMATHGGLSIISTADLTHPTDAGYSVIRNAIESAAGSSAALGAYQSYKQDAQNFAQPSVALSVAAGGLLATQAGPNSNQLGPNYPVLGGDGAPGPGWNFSVPTGSTFGWRGFTSTPSAVLSQVWGISPTGGATFTSLTTPYAATGGIVATQAGPSSTTAGGNLPTLSGDGAATPGWNFSVPVGSTYGWRYFNTAANGTLTQVATMDAQGNGAWNTVKANVSLGFTSGPAWTNGPNAPTGACVSGSLYTNSGSTAAGTSLYVCRQSAWQAVSGG